MSNSWDQVSLGVSELNVSAKPFVPNVNAAAFVPSFTKPAPILLPQEPALQPALPSETGSVPAEGICCFH